MNSAIYYICVVNEKGPKENVGRFMGDYALTSSVRGATTFSTRETAERHAERLPYLTVVPLTMTW